MNNVTQHRQGQQVLGPIDVAFPAQQLTVLTGPSGGGKTSLLRLLNRLDEVSAGQILLGATDIYTLPAPELRRRVGMVMQRPTMFSGTVLQNLQHSFSLQQLPLPAADSTVIARVLELCGVESELLQRNAQRLSIGQQQRVSLARTLLAEPQVLLLDEPTSALDRPSADRLGLLLQQLCRQQGLTVIMVSHDLRLAERVADQVLFLAAGQLVEQGGAEILRQPQSQQLQNFLNDPQLTEQPEVTDD